MDRGWGGCRRLDDAHFGRDDGALGHRPLLSRRARIVVVRGTLPAREVVDRLPAEHAPLRLRGARIVDRVGARVEVRGEQIARVGLPEHRRLAGVVALVADDLLGHAPQVRRDLAAVELIERRGEVARERWHVEPGTERLGALSLLDAPVLARLLDPPDGVTERLADDIVTLPEADERVHLGKLRQGVLDARDDRLDGLAAGRVLDPAPDEVILARQRAHQERVAREGDALCGHASCLVDVARHLVRGQVAHDAPDDVRACGGLERGVDARLGAHVEGLEILGRDGPGRCAGDLGGAHGACLGVERPGKLRRHVGHLAHEDRLGHGIDRRRVEAQGLGPVPQLRPVGELLLRRQLAHRDHAMIARAHVERWIDDRRAVRPRLGAEGGLVVPLGHHLVDDPAIHPRPGLEFRAVARLRARAQVRRLDHPVARLHLPPGVEGAQVGEAGRAAVDARRCSTRNIRKVDALSGGRVLPPPAQCFLREVRRLSHLNVTGSHLRLDCTLGPCRGDPRRNESPSRGNILAQENRHVVLGLTSDEPPHMAQAVVAERSQAVLNSTHDFVESLEGPTVGNAERLDAQRLPQLARKHPVGREV